MDNFKMSAVEMNRTNVQVNEANKKLGPKKINTKNGLGKESFLKLLVTQLKHQDPTKPMEDTQFISQMAQFSSLEQMSNINKEMKAMRMQSESSQAYGMLGKRVDAFDPVTKKNITGVVNSIKVSGDQLRLVVGNSEIPINNVQTIHYDNSNTSNVKK